MSNRNLQRSYLGTERSHPEPENPPDLGEHNGLQQLTRPCPAYPRRFLPDTIDPSSWEAMRPYADRLIAEKIPTPRLMRRWMDNHLEFLNVVYEEKSRLYIGMTCNTADPVKNRQYLDYVEKLEPQLEIFLDACHRKIISHPLRGTLNKKLFGKWLLSLRSQMKLFSAKNLALQSRIHALSHAYQKTCGAMTVRWEEKDRTVVSMNKVLLEADRRKREQAWRKTWRRFIVDREKLDGIFRKLFNLRTTVSRNLKFPDYRSYCFRKYERTDYSARDCFAFHETVEKVVVPVYREVLEYRKSRLGVSALRPWDLACDIRHRQELRPFSGAGELTKGVETIVRQLDPELHGFFRTMRNKGLLDLENRVGKAPGGYQIILDECRLPFIFMNAVGTNQDVFTLLHETGHAMHLFLCRDYAMPYDREPPKEFCEVASMSMERFGMSGLEAFYTRENAARAVTAQNEEVFRLFVWVAIIDSFQHWIYAHPRQSAESRNRAWMETMERFQAGLDWSGLDDFRKTAWHRQLHIFQYPFYYIEYGIALVGALQLWTHFLKDRKKTMARYKAALRCGGTIGLRQLFETAGIVFDFSPRTMEPLIMKVYDDWKSLRGV